ncbi:MAG: tetratricopeptide repeat protein [Pseudomonadota bacterium]
MRLLLPVIAPFLLGFSPPQLIDLSQDEEAFEDAFKEALNEAKKGDPEAHDRLGWAYENGRGVELDYKAAAHHYRIAAQGGNEHSRWRLGVMIDEGRTLGELSEAVALFTIGAQNGYLDALVSLAVMQATGRGTERDFTAALGSYMKAAKAGNAAGIRGVALMIVLGEGVEADPQEAASWFMVAGALGNQDAINNLNIVLEQMIEPDRGAIAARAYEVAEELGLEITIVFEENSDTQKS